MKRITVGVMGSAASPACAELQEAARTLGQAAAEAGCILLSGETSGLPEIAACGARAAGGMTVGVSAACSYEEHLQRFPRPAVCSDFIVYTGFGHKGRNVINIRSSDLLIFINGRIGTLNEFTIAYDEGKIIGVLEGSGGCSDMLRGIVDTLGKDTGAVMIYEREPRMLLRRCIEQYHKRSAGAVQA